MPRRFHKRRSEKDHPSLSPIACLRAEVRRFEEEYGMTAVEAHAAIDEGTLRETHEVCRWLIWSELLRSVDGE